MGLAFCFSVQRERITNEPTDCPGFVLSLPSIFFLIFFVAVLALISFDSVLVWFLTLPWLCFDFSCFVLTVLILF